MKNNTLCIMCLTFIFKLMPRNIKRREFVKIVKHVYTLAADNLLLH